MARVDRSEQSEGGLAESRLAGRGDGSELAESRFRDAFESSVVGMALSDTPGVFLAVNPAFAKMLGYSRSELVGRPVLDVIHPDDRAVVTAGMEKMSEQHEPRTEGEYRHLRKDGEVVVGRVTVAPVLGVDGSPEFFVVHVEDVTELRRVQAELQEMQALHRVVIENSHDVLAVLDLEGTVVLTSPSIERSLGYGEHELAGHGFMELIHPDDLPTTVASVGAAAGGTSVLNRARIRAKDGSFRLWEGIVARAGGTDGAPTFLVANARDVTRQAELEEQLRQSQKMESVGRLAGGVAHDFNNLLTGIRGYAELALAKPAGDDSSVELVGVIDAAERAARLTAQLLAFSRRQVLDPQVFDLRDAVSGMAELLRRIVKSNVELVTIVPEQEAPVYADRVQIEQALTNLVVNAGEAMPSGGRVSIEVVVDAANRQVRLLAADDGVGMDAATAAEIFEPFFSTRGVGGNGLGLSMVQGIISQSGGQISVESTPGEGTTFTICLPLAEQAQAQKKPQTDTLPSSDTPRVATVLLVEDDPVVRDVVGRMLLQHGYRLWAAANGEEALALAQATPGSVDLLVTDLVMPGLNGRETAEAIRESQPQTQVLYMSGYTDDEVVRIGGYEPGTAFLQKPFSGDQLDAKVRELLHAALF